MSHCEAEFAEAISVLTVNSLKIGFALTSRTPIAMTFSVLEKIKVYFPWPYQSHGYVSKFDEFNR